MSVWSFKEWFFLVVLKLPVRDSFFYCKEIRICFKDISFFLNFFKQLIVGRHCILQKGSQTSKYVDKPGGRDLEEGGGSPKEGTILLCTLCRTWCRILGQHSIFVKKGTFFEKKKKGITILPPLIQTCS